jgi:hypothetical protein
MGLKKLSILLAAVLAMSAVMTISTRGAAQGACDPAAGLTFICGMTNAEDLVQLPGTPWIIASGLADSEHPGGHIYLVNAQDRSVRVLLPGHVVYRQDSATFAGCPGEPDETKFSAHGLSLRAGAHRRIRSMSHGSGVGRGLTEGRIRAPSLTWVGCVLYPASVLSNGVATRPAAPCREHFSHRRPEAAGN